MFFKKGIAVSETVREKIKVASRKLGVTEDEFVNRVLQVEADKVIRKGSDVTVSKEEEERIAEQLKGLGYIE